jgi:hypothetical protein
MRMVHLLALVAPFALLSALPACHRDASTDASVTAESASDALVEDHEGGSVAWTVDASGRVSAVATGADGKPVTENLSGSLAWKDGDETKTIPLAVDAKTHALVAAGPKLSADLTEVGYTLSVDGKPWSGTLHLPPGGTAELAADAKANVDAKVDANVEGPHGGHVEIVGGDRVELVEGDGGEVRVYVLGEDLEPVAVGERKVSVAVVAERPEIVVLVPEPGGLYFTGKLHVEGPPSRVTIAVRTGAHVSVVLVGYRPGVHVVVGARAPHVRIRGRGGFVEKASVKVKGNGGVDVKVKGGNGVDVKVKTHGGGPSVKVKGHGGAKMKF